MLQTSSSSLQKNCKPLSSISSRDQFVFHIIFISRASLTFPEVRNRKGTERGLNIHNAFTNIVISFSKTLWCSQLVYVANVIVVIAKKKVERIVVADKSPWCSAKINRAFWYLRALGPLMCIAQCFLQIFAKSGIPSMSFSIFHSTKNYSSIFLPHGTKKLFLAIPTISDAAIKVICRPL